MVAARSAAMGFNRLVDARLRRAQSADGDARAAARRDDAGEASVFVVVSSVLFVFAAWKLGPLCFALSPVALAIVFWYSLAKRVHELHAAVSRPGDGGRAGRRLAGGGRPRRLGAVAARPRDRHVGRRLRRAVCLPGSRVRSRARAALDSGPLRRAPRRWRSRACMHVDHRAAASPRWPR